MRHAILYLGSRPRGRASPRVISDPNRSVAGTTTGVQVLGSYGPARAVLSRIARAVMAAAVLVGVLVVGVAPAGAQSSDSGLAPEVIVVEGRGFGHGNGLSQWGALGYAVDYSWTSDRIVGHYYSNTTLTDEAERDVWVHLTRNRGDLLVTSASAFSVADRDFSGGSVVRVGVSGGDFFVRSDSGCGSRGNLVDDDLGIKRRGDRYVEVLPANGDYRLD